MIENTDAEQIERLNSRVADLMRQLASARKALEGVYDHMDRNGMANWPVAKRVRKELDSLTSAYRKDEP